MELEPILHVWIHTDSDLVDLTITMNTHAPHSTKVTKTKEVVHTNQKHPFFTLEKGFVPVGQLKLGMHVLRADGQFGVITGWKIVPGTKVMYNLEVAQDHTFVVGQGQWVVHNRCDRGQLRRKLNLGPIDEDPYQAQHLIPCELEVKGSIPSNLIVQAQRAGLNFNSAWNGIGLPFNEEVSGIIGLPWHRGSHANYTRQVRDFLSQLEARLSAQYNGNIPDDIAISAVMQFASQIQNRIWQSNGGGVCINDIVL